MVVGLTGLITFAAFFSPTSLTAAEPGFAPIPLDISPIDNFALTDTGERFALEFRGGFAISSSDNRFGSLSGLDFAADGSLLAVSDTGFWFAAHAVEQDGRLIDLEDGRLAPILDRGGKPLNGKYESDAESLRIHSGNGPNEALVAFEQRNEIRRFTGPDFATAKPEPVRLPAAIEHLDRNSGLEAIALAPRESAFAGALLVFAEHFLDKAGNHRAWIVDGPRAGAFSIVRKGEFDVTDADFLPGGDLLILERRFSFLTGFAMRIRRIAGADILPGATVDGRILIEADMRYQIDNMEAMAVRPGRNSETLVTLCSDNNGSVLQRSLMLQFALPADVVPMPRPNTAR